MCFAFLTETVDVRDGIDRLQFSDGYTLSSTDLNDIALPLATDFRFSSCFYFNFVIIIIFVVYND